MSHRVGILEAAPEALLLQGDADDLFTRQRATHLHGRRPMSIGEHRILEPDLVKRSENIGAELDAGADLPELRGLLQDTDRKALAGERIAGRKPADAAAGNENGLPGSVLGHVQLLRVEACAVLPACAGSIAQRRRYQAAKSIAWSRGPMQMQASLRASRAERAKRFRAPKGALDRHSGVGGWAPH